MHSMTIRWICYRVSSFSKLSIANSATPGAVIPPYFFWCEASPPKCLLNENPLDVCCGSDTGEYTSPQPRNVLKFRGETVISENWKYACDLCNCGLKVAKRHKNYNENGIPHVRKSVQTSMKIPKMWGFQQHTQNFQSNSFNPCLRPNKQ